jgi:pimeloyl-ACP methyl ester carboxylesterase
VYRDVLPRLASRGYSALAFDTPGFGASDPLPGEASIERWAQAVHDALDVLGVERTAVVGHHTGGSIAVELAARWPARVSALILSSTSLTDAEYRAAPPDESGIDDAQDAEELRSSRASFYPSDRPDLLDRYLADALKACGLALAGHHIVGAYEMERKIASLRAPVLVIGATDDPYAYPQFARMKRALPTADSAEIVGGMVPLPDGWPAEFAEAVADFLDRVGAA